MKKIKKRYIERRMGLAGLAVIMVLSMCSCGSKETVVVEKQKVKQEKTKAETKKEYLEKTYGIADSVTYGKRIGHTEADRTVGLRLTMVYYSHGIVNGLTRCTSLP